MNDLRIRKRVNIWGQTNTRAGRYVTARSDAEGLLFEAWGSSDGLQARTVLASPFDEYPDLATQLRNIRRSQGGPWRAVSIREAMGVPAIFGAVNLIANLTGSMSMKAFRGQVEIPADDRPRVIVRPDPFTIPREFYRGTSYNIASRGEADWWIAARDSDRNALSVINMPPQEVTIEENPKDLRYPVVKWRGKVIPNEDFRQLVYSREPGELRGVGPLQMCGAAISVAVESQLWAANFFSGGNSAIWVKTSIPLSGGDTDEDEDSATFGQAEVDRFLTQWMDKDPNTPRITDDTIEDIKELNINPQGAAMLQARQYQNSEVATMFNMDAAVLNAAVSGSSITYQNVGSKFEQLLRECLQPGYLETIEQTMSDLLPRSIVARFNTDRLTMPDQKGRWEVYGLAVPVIGEDEAAAMAREGEGLSPGDVENAAVPFSPPSAVPSAAPFQARSVEVRCENMVTKRRSGITRMAVCGKLLSTDGTRPSFCPRCKSSTVAA